MSKQADTSVEHALLERSPDGVLVVRKDRTVEYANPAFCQFFDVAWSDLAGGRLNKVLPLEPLLELVETTLDGRGIKEVALVSGPFELTLSPVHLKGHGVMVLVHDVTRFRKAERLRSDFVANVSHELRTPMASIMGYAETLLLEQERLDEDIMPLVQAIHRNSKRLRDLFEDLLHLSRIEARARELPLTKRHLRPLLAEAVVDAVDRAANKNQTFELFCKHKLQAWVNPEALSAIIANLATNAVTYTQEGGRVQVRVQKHDDDIAIEVIDDGIGIANDQQGRIFERFYRVDPGRSRNAGGTGLGLAIVKHLALASRCRIEVESSPGKGSTFRVWLPRPGVPGWVPS